MREKEIKERKAIKKPYFIALWLMIIAVVGCQKTEPSNTSSNTPSVHQTAEPIEEKQVRIHFIDTGNSDAILIEQGVVGQLVEVVSAEDSVLVFTRTLPENKVTVKVELKAPWTYEITAE
mgnify:CR=1 FL=1